MLLSEKVEFLLVGGYALAVHGAPRFTEDIDFFVLLSPENADRIVTVIERFGFGGLDLNREDFLKPDFVVQLGRAPNRIDLLTGIDGVEWSGAWASRITVDFGGLTLPVIGKDLLIRNKLATGRTQDRADAERLSQRIGQGRSGQAWNERQIQNSKFQDPRSTHRQRPVNLELVP